MRRRVCYWSSRPSATMPKAGSSSPPGPPSRASSRCRAPTFSKTRSSKMSRRARLPSRCAAWANCGQSTSASPSRACCATEGHASCSYCSGAATSASAGSGRRAAGSSRWCSTRRGCSSTTLARQAWHSNAASSHRPTRRRRRPPPPRPSRLRAGPTHCSMRWRRRLHRTIWRQQKSEPRRGGAASGSSACTLQPGGRCACARRSGGGSSLLCTPTEAATWPPSSW
mmetsp:Transcript_37467/g.120413  ORF Transcript_37467/g.120413 Transcript_37467/m.120413 type:complete len:226 (-) Transcript_37467:466-1143(-)